MKVISRRENEGLVIGTDIAVTVLQIRKNHVRLAIACPRLTPSYWEETLSFSEEADLPGSGKLQLVGVEGGSAQLAVGESAEGLHPTPRAILEVGPPVFAIAWDPQFVTEDEYAELVAILGDLVRANGGAGIRRLIEEDVGVVGAEVLQS